jgi:hypothetical protein|tara:strand:- start:8047 stop:8235 length:189 start_codon:yes stop_codon:yes gene_type:complete
MDLESDFVFDEITNVAYPLLAEVCLNESFAKKELIEIILEEDWCGEQMAERVVNSWLELERS